VNVDFVLPLFAPSCTEGSSVHFTHLASALQQAGHDVVVHSSTSSRFERVGARLRWRGDLRGGVSRLSGLAVRRYAARERSLSASFEHLLAASGAARRVLGFREAAPAPSIAERMPGTREEALALLGAIREAAAGSARRHHLRRMQLLGPSLPAQAIVAHARRRRAVLVVGYFPFRCCWDVVEQATAQGVRCFVLPLFHPLEPLHHNVHLTEAAQRADGVLCLSPFTRDYFDASVCPGRAHLLGSAPAPIAADGLDGARSETPYFVFIGRNELGKNLPEAIRIVDLVRAGLGEDCVLKVLSPLTDAEVEALPSFVRCVPSATVLEVARLLKGARALLFPSLLESFGLVALEALRVGTPVLVKASNLATASVLEQLGLGAWVYSSEDEAARKAASPDAHPVARADLSFYSWPRIAERFGALVGPPAGA
jgi:glycosyltransferase involved in cell wall biosynthesis